MKLRPILCPRCRSADVKLVELAATELVHSARHEASDQRPGDIEKTIFVCVACKHQHTMRGVAGIDAGLLERLAVNREILKAQQRSAPLSE